ncbi:hypothetical protein RclHR1_08950002 [Rhizophagus clarus]|uniref:Uncharacterized protein n=1 Tax=Rhizophagus clarus TaxID=94130 RepID=A0A2Z6S2Q1_9GLOM|nr:hypothetical protein RclHR1_08950002 [Rhizophagus clarus]GET03469.1 hypothetical protein GLOIN_2v1476741 [Rhizophagus clarus]
MIANITTILYILNVSDEIINSGTLQKGTAISRVDGNDGFQIYKYSNYLTSASHANSDSSNDIETTPFEEENMYLIMGKFSVSQDDSINVTIISNIHIPLDKDDIPIMKPTVNFVGKTMNYAQLTEVGYTLQIQVKPYLSKKQFNPFLINLTHPVSGRFKNALTKAKKNSTIHTTGLFFLADKQLYCEILEFQFIMEQRINLIRQNLETKPSPSLPLANTSKQGHGGRKSSTTKISEISKSLLSQDQHIEVIDSDQEINDNEEIEEIEGIGENIEEDNNDDAPNKPKRPKRKRK